MEILIHKNTLSFLKELSRNNDREWFNANKDRYLTAHENFTQWVQALILKMADFDESLRGLDAKKTIFRIYRDTRFSKDKSPYKPNFGAWLVDKSKGFKVAGYYIHLEPGGCFLAGGVHMPESPYLREIRKEISANADEFLKIVNHKTFKAHFTFSEDKLSRIPQGFQADDPTVEFLKLRELTVMHGVSDKDLTAPSFLDYSYKVFKLMHPFNEFLNRVGVDG